MAAKAAMPERRMNLVLPLPHKGTATRTTGTTGSTPARPGAVTTLIGHAFGAAT
jgi:hypothetical protein